MKIEHTAYNFVGDVVSVNENVYKHGDYNVKIVLAKRRTVNTYHPGTRLLANTTVTQIDKNGNTSTQTVSSPTYDFLGNVIADNRPGSAADMTYTYNLLHGWLSGISSPCGFSEQLLRDSATNAQYSGNIGSMQWRNTANGEQHRYDYTYDSLGRLTYSQYASSVNGASGHFDESVTYNPNGSITSLLRNGMKNNGTFGLIDDLAISYDGNRLLKVTDDAEALNYNGALDFNDGDDANCEYEYDSDGALTRDSNRGINSISYDYSHHPYGINMDINNRPRNILNDYTSDGRKLSSRHRTSIPKVNGYTLKTTTDLYVDGLILRGGTPLLWQFDGGYVELDANGTPTSWNYYITDHLGSTRMVVSNDSIRETINYYPFGSEMKMENPALLTGGISHPFRFTGKELDRLSALNMYDFGARWYDVAGVPMWTSMDPLCEKYYSVSPYAYCTNNPVIYIDPDGKDGIISIYGNNITISANVYLYGYGATKPVLQQMQKDINNLWGKNFSIDNKGKTYNVKFDIKLFLYDEKERNNPLIIEDAWNPSSRNNYIKVTNDSHRSKIDWGDEGVWRSKGRYGLPLSKDDPAPHEVGHLLGLEDQYVDGEGPNKGWENNIMGDSRKGKVDNRNISDILKNVWENYDKWLNDGNKGVFKYEIDP